MDDYQEELLEYHAFELDPLDRPMMPPSCKTDVRRNAADCGEIPLGSGCSSA